MSLILGLDPGSQYTGYGIIEKQGDEVIHKDHGVINLSKFKDLPRRLNLLHQELEAIVKQYQPQDVAIEKIFVGKNVDSAFKLGHVRGVCMQVAAANNCSVFEYAAKTVKKSVTGHGGATKEQVSLLATGLLKIRTDAKLDATDALGLAICHARKSQERELLLRQEGLQR